MRQRRQNNSEGEKQNTPLTREETIRKAEYYCARAEHCEAEVRRKLYQWGAAEYTEAVISHLRDNGYIDDDRYCSAFVHDHLLINHWAPLKIKQALMARYLPAESIARALEGYACTPEEEDY